MRKSAFIALVGFILFSSGCMSLAASSIKTDPEELAQYPLEEIVNIHNTKHNKEDMYISLQVAMSDLKAKEKYKNAQMLNFQDFEYVENALIRFTCSNYFILENVANAKARVSFDVRIELKDNKIRISTNNVKGYWYCLNDGGHWEEQAISRNYKVPKMIDAKNVRPIYYDKYHKTSEYLNEFILDVIDNYRSW